MTRSLTQKFYFARLNLLGPYNDKRDLLFRSLSSTVTIEYRGFRYGFFNPIEITVDDGLFVSGQVGKYKKYLEGEVVDEERHQIVEGGLPGGVVATSGFFLHYRSGIVAYHPVPNKISLYQFKNIFGRLIEEANDSFFVQAQLQLINEELTIEEALRSFHHIYRISIEVHPTNPGAGHVYKSLDNRLKRLGADSYKNTIMSKDGINKNALDENEEIYKGLVMATDGYGKGVIEGIVEDREVTITTEDSPISKGVTKSEHSSEVLNALIPTLKGIWRRIRQ